MEFAKSETKQWAKENYGGLDGVLSPSFTPDLSQLDEEGMRYDVRHNIDKGMFSFLCQTEVCAMTMEERKRFVEIACDEAGGMYRQPAVPIFQRQKDAMRAGLKAAGITPREPDEEFYVGRLNYAKGARLKY